MHYISEHLDVCIQLRSVDYFKVDLQIPEGESLGVCDVYATTASLIISEPLPSFGLPCRSRSSRPHNVSCQEPGVASPE